MGICVSVGRSDCESSPTAKIVSVNGNLRDYNLPMLAWQVLEAESTASSSSSSSRSDSYFICNSDSLCYEDIIPALKPDDLLQSNQIYFVLPISKRQSPLSASEMAAMAVKASIAIQNSSAGKKSRRRKNGRISPVMVLNQSNDHIAINEREATRISAETTTYKKKFATKPAPFKAAAFSRSSSVRRMQRYSARRAKLAVRSFRLRLSTINEGVVL